MCGELPLRGSEGMGDGGMVESCRFNTDLGDVLKKMTTDIGLLFYTYAINLFVNYLFSYTTFLNLLI